MRFILPALAGLALLAASPVLSQSPPPSQPPPIMGAIQAYLNATSLNDLLDDFAIVMPDFIASEEDFVFDLDLKLRKHSDLHLYGVRLERVEIGHREIRIVPGELYPTLLFNVSEVDVVAHITGGLEAGHLQMFNFTEVEISGLSASFELGVVADHQNNTAFWQVAAASQVDFENLRLHTDSAAANSALQVFHQFLVLYLKAEENGYQDWVEKTLTEYNLLLRTRSSFLVPWPDAKHHHLNATVTYAPKLDADSQLAEVSLDGRIFDTLLKTSHVEGATAKAERLASYPGNQLFLHESFLASYFYAVYDRFMPYEVADISASLEIIAEFPEIKAAYGGHGTAVNMSLMLSPASGRFVSVSREHGLALGKQDDLYLTMELYCANEAVGRAPELCVTFDIRADVALNLTLADFDLYLLIKEATLHSVEITKDKVGMKERDYQRVLQHVLNYGVANFNYVNSVPMHLNSSGSALQPVFEEFVTLEVSSFVQDQFLFVGFDALSNVAPALYNQTVDLLAQRLSTVAQLMKAAPRAKDQMLTLY